MIRRLVPLVLAGLLAACNTGDSFLEWDAETQAMLDRQEAEAEAATRGDAAAEAGEEGAGVMALPAAVPEGATQIPIVALTADGTAAEGILLRNASGTRSNQVEVRWMTGTVCGGGLVEQSGAAGTSAGTMALNCDDGTVWIGEYAATDALHGAWTLRSGGGTQARALYGDDVVADPAAFEALWATRGMGS